MTNLLRSHSKRKEDSFSISNGIKATVFAEVEPALAGRDEVSVLQLHRAVRYAAIASSPPNPSPISRSSSTRSNARCKPSTSIDQEGPLSGVPVDLPSNEVEIITEGGPVAGGAFADVYMGAYNDQSVAIKAIRRMKEIDPASMNRKFERESRTWWLLEHDNILPLLGFVENPSISPHKLMVSPWCDYGNLADFMKNNPTIPPSMRIDLFLGVAEGLRYLHTRKPTVVHGDLKPANILIDSHWTPKLGDFGLVRVITEDGPTGYTTTSSHLGTLRYLAPELVGEVRIRPFLRKSSSSGDNMQCVLRPTTFSDTYALGTIGMEVITSIVPYIRIPGDGHGLQYELITAIRQGKPPAKRPEDLHRVVEKMWEQLFNATWKRTPSERPAVEDICSLLKTYKSDPFFQA